MTSSPTRPIGRGCDVTSRAGDMCRKQCVSVSACQPHARWRRGATQCTACRCRLRPRSSSNPIKPTTGPDRSTFIVLFFASRTGARQQFAGCSLRLGRDRERIATVTSRHTISTILKAARRTPPPPPITWQSNDTRMTSRPAPPSLHGGGNAGRGGQVELISRPIIWRHRLDGAVPARQCVY